MEQHYKNLAKSFDINWDFSNNYKKWAIIRIGKYLELNTNDTFIDIGGGTGIFTHMISLHYKIKQAICVEPEKSMCKIARGYTTFQTICSNALSFANKKNYSCSKLLFKEVIHHINDRKKLWDKIYSNTTKNTRILIYTRPQNIEFPLFKKAKNKFLMNQPHHNSIMKELQQSGFNTEVYFEDFVFEMSKDSWHKMIKNKFMSDLSTFSDSEIENGIKEIEQQYNTNTYIIKDKIIFIIAYK